METIVSGLPAGGGHTPRASPSLGRRDVREHRIGHQQLPGDRPAPALAGRRPVYRARPAPASGASPPARAGQKLADGARWATGLRNTTALAVDPATGRALRRRPTAGTSCGRTGASPERRTPRIPAEELVAVRAGRRFRLALLLLQHRGEGRRCSRPEYGGDGKQVGRCADGKAPVIAFPGSLGADGAGVLQGRRLPRLPRLVEPGTTAAGGIPRGLRSLRRRNAGRQLFDLRHRHRRRHLLRASGVAVADAAQCTFQPTRTG